jgi:hypothetical protein
LAEWLLEQIAEDEREVDLASGGDYCDDRRYFHSADRALSECEAKRRIIEWHKNWPVLVTTQPTFETVPGADPTSYAMRAYQQIAWTTEQEYRKRFGDEPPTSPILRILASVYADRPGYLEEWRP